MVLEDEHACLESHGLGDGAEQYAGVLAVAAVEEERFQGILPVFVHVVRVGIVFVGDVLDERQDDVRLELIGFPGRVVRYVIGDGLDVLVLDIIIMEEGGVVFQVLLPFSVVEDVWYLNAV